MEMYDPTCDAESALNAAALTERDAFRELVSAPAVDAKDIIAKASADRRHDRKEPG